MRNDRAGCGLISLLRCAGVSLYVDQTNTFLQLGGSSMSDPAAVLPLLRVEHANPPREGNWDRKRKKWRRLLQDPGAAKGKDFSGP